MENLITQTAFLHGVFLADRLKCSNILETGQLHSLMQAALYIPGTRADYYTLPLEQLKNNPHQIFQGHINARAGALLEAAIIRSGKQLIKFGKKASREYQDHKLKVADTEIAFEKHRRTISPERQLPSRITALFLCKDDIPGYKTIQAMLDSAKEFYISSVHIPITPLGFHQADHRWYDAYQKEPKPKYIEKYWAGEPFDEENRWEYLLEGTITFSQEDIEHIRRFGKI